MQNEETGILLVFFQTINDMINFQHATTTTKQTVTEMYWVPLLYTIFRFYGPSKICEKEITTAKIYAKLYRFRNHRSIATYSEMINKLFCIFQNHEGLGKVRTKHLD